MPLYIIEQKSVKIKEIDIWHTLALKTWGWVILVGDYLAVKGPKVNVLWHTLALKILFFFFIQTLTPHSCSLLGIAHTYDCF